MHYQHQFHAGNFADVFKHTLLCGLLAALNRKDTPWCFLDTHAGAGAYRLDSVAADKTGEWREGIARLAELADAPEPLATLLRLVREENPGGGLRNYPGSPQIARALARPQDRVVLCEKVPAIAAQLKANCAGVELHLRDGYEAASLLPPKEKRGLILIDPPFERPDEFDAAAQFLKAAQARFAHGIYAVWYALKNRRAADQFLRKVAALNRPWRAYEFETGEESRFAGIARGDSERPHSHSGAVPSVQWPLGPLNVRAGGSRSQGVSASAPEMTPKHRMHACGVLVLNPPFQFDQDIRAAMDVLVEHLAQGPNALFEIKTATPA